MRRKKTVVLLVFMTLVVIGAGVALWMGTSPSMDPDAKPKSSQSMTAEEWEEFLQEQLQESELRIKVNTALTVEPDGSTDLLLENPVENSTNIQAILTLSDGAILYRSASLPPGGQELLVQLIQIPAQGSHTGTVTIQALDPESGAVTGQVEVEVVMEVKAAVEA